MIQVNYNTVERSLIRIIQERVVKRGKSFPSWVLREVLDRQRANQSERAGVR